MQRTVTTRRARTVALALAAALYLFVPATGGPSSASAQESTPLPVMDVNAFDRLIVLPYSEPMDVASDFTQYAAFLTPAIFSVAAPVDDWLGIGAMYAGSAVLSFGARTALKAVVERNRPYMYYDDPPASAVADGDYLDSFPSGHAIMAFTGAGFTAALFSLRYPDSPYRVPSVIASYALAAVTAGLRVGSGSHFLTDALAGAAIGSLFGIAVPYAADALGLLD